MSSLKPRIPNAISQGLLNVSGRPRGASGGNGLGALVSSGKPHHNASSCIACAACAVACDTRAISIAIDEQEGLLVWTLDLADCSWCGRCAVVCPTQAMTLVEGSHFADNPEPPKRCLFALRACAKCDRYYATNKEIDYANKLLTQEENPDTAHARELTMLCPDCKRAQDANAAARRAGLKRW